MTISEVSERYGITKDTLRYYERIGILPKVKRLKNGIRIYEEIDCRWIEFIKCMRAAGVSIEILVEYVKLSDEENIEARKELLKEQRELILKKIKELNNSLEILNYKLENYEKIVIPAEEEMREQKNH